MNLDRSVMAMAQGIAGALECDETWGGTLKISGDVIVPQGITLRIAAGTRIQTIENVACAWRKQTGTTDISAAYHDESLNGLFILGRLVIEGRDSSPVCIGGPEFWDGIHVVNGGQIHAAHAVFSSPSSNITVHPEGLLNLADCRLRAGQAPNLRCFGGSLRVERSILHGGSPMLLARNARTHIEEVRFTGPSTCAMDLEGGRHLLQDVEIQEARAGLVLSAGSACAHGLRVSGCEEAVSVRNGSHLDWVRGSIAKTASGIVLFQAGASVRDVACREASGIGVHLQAGSRIDLRSSTIQACCVGLMLQGESGSFIETCVDGSSLMPVYAQSGKYVFSKHAGAGIILEETASVLCNGKRPAGAPQGSSWSGSWILPFVLRSRGLRPVRRFYRSLYVLAELLMRRLAEADPNVSFCRSWRGWRRGDWNPGVSDLDFLLAAKALSGQAGLRWVGRFWNFHARWKRIIPFLGEILVAEEDEILKYADSGGARVPEIPLPRGPSSKRQADRPLRHLIGTWTECAYSYARLIEWQRHYLSHPWELRRAQIFKSALDVLRHLPVDGAPQAVLNAPSRKFYWENLASTPFARAGKLLRPLLKSEDPDFPKETLLAELWAYLLRQMHAAAGETREHRRRPDDLPLPTRPASNAPSHEFLHLWDPSAKWEPILQRCKDCFGDDLRGALFNDLYPSYALLDDGAIRKQELGERLERHAGLNQPSPLVIVLSRRLWHLWAGLPYLENPVLFMDSESLCAGRLAPERHQYAWSDTRPAIPASPWIQASSALALAHFKLVWRWSGSAAAGLSSRTTFHYLLSRALGLKLLERGIIVPFFHLRYPMDAYRSEFPETSEFLQAIEPEGGMRSPAEVFHRYYSFLDAQLRK
ncbi:MAG: hypothetical protein HY551_05950 [Elusimicrobia bacterium]|nr:hypothetical protein [Elusimicrobiota bacterium]